MKQTTKKLWSFVLAFSMILSMLTVFGGLVTFAADPGTITVTFTDGTTASLTDTADDATASVLAVGDGTITYDADTATVAFNDITAKKVVFAMNDAFTLQVNGTNTVHYTGGSSLIDVTTGSVTVTGDGVLDLEGSSYVINVRAGSYTQTGASVVATLTAGRVIYTAGTGNNITISGGSIKGSGTSNLIVPNSGRFVMSGGTVTLSGTSEVLRTTSGDLTVSGGKLTVSGTTNVVITGSSSNVNISGGEVTINASTGYCFNSGKNMTVSQANAAVPTELTLNSAAGYGAIRLNKASTTLAFNGGLIMGEAPYLLWSKAATCKLTLAAAAQMNFNATTRTVSNANSSIDPGTITVADDVEWETGSLTADGNGLMKNVENNYVFIDNEEEFLAIGTDATSLGKYYRLTADLDFSDVEWAPLGAFTGVLNGAGHKISNLHTGTASAPHSTGSTAYDWGIFSSVSGTVKNLAIENLSFYLTSTSTGSAGVGAVCGFISANATIESVAVLSGTISATMKHQLGVGGIAGSTGSSTTGWTISNCYNGADLTGICTRSKDSSYAAVAGMIGRAWSKAGNTIINCVNVGNIRATVSGSTTTATLVGHIISSQSGNVTRAVVRKNNYGIEGTLSYDGTNAGILTDDVNKTNVVSLEDASVAETFATLKGAWTTQSGYYPIPDVLSAYAVKMKAIFVRTYEQLRKIGLDEDYPADGNYLLSSDIDLSAVDWYPIGYNPDDATKVAFTGTFDGQGHVIENMHRGTAETPYVDSGDGAVLDWGFFWMLSGATVRNLAFRSVQLHISVNPGTTTKTNNSAAAVAGRIIGASVVDSCAVLSGSISMIGVHQVGASGIVGVHAYPDTAADSAWTIRNCFNAASVTATSSYARGSGGYACAAGMISRPWSRSGDTVTGCLNVGEIKSVDLSETTGDAWVLSLAGHMISYQGVTSASEANATVRTNNYSLTGAVTAEGVHAAVYQTDANATTLVDQYQAADAATFSGLTNTGSWTVKAPEGNVYYYPIPTIFADYAVAFSIDERALIAQVQEQLATVVPSNYLTVADLEAVLAELVPSAEISLTQTAVATFTQQGGWNATVTLQSGTEVPYTYVVTMLPTVTGFSYAYDTETPGVGQGTVTVTLSGDYVHGNYELFWGTESGVLEGYSYLASTGNTTRTVFDDLVADGNTLTFTTADLLLIPVGATRLYVTADDLAAYTYEIPAARQFTGDRRYTFGALSDVHVATSDGSAYNNYVKTMNIFNADDTVNFVVLNGDNTNNSRLSQYQLLQSATGDMPLWANLGNHDIIGWNRDAAATTKARAVEYTRTYIAPGFANPDYTTDSKGNQYKVTVADYEGDDRDWDYTVEYEGDLFIYLNIGVYDAPDQYYTANGTATKNVEQHLTVEQLKWLGNVLNASGDYGHVYLFFHYYTLESGCGMRSNAPTSTGTEWSVSVSGVMTDWVTSAELDNLLRQYPNLIYFSGHTHFSFKSYQVMHLDRYGYTAVNRAENFYLTDEKLGYTSISIPSNYASNEGYYVESYDDGVLVRGYDFAANETLSYASFFVPEVEKSEVIPTQFTKQITRDVNTITGDGVKGDQVTREGDTVSQLEIAGSQIRYNRSTGAADLRFVARVSTDMLTELQTEYGEENVEYGILLQLTDKADVSSSGKIFLTEENINGKSLAAGGAVAVPGVKTFKTYSNYIYYTAAITGMPESYYATELTARAYVKINDTYYFADETPGTTYASGASEQNGGYSTSWKNVAGTIARTTSLTDNLSKSIRELYYTIYPDEQ